LDAFEIALIGWIKAALQKATSFMDMQTDYTTWQNKSNRRRISSRKESLNFVLHRTQLYFLLPDSCGIYTLASKMM